MIVDKAHYIDVLRPHCHWPYAPVIAPTSIQLVKMSWQFDVLFALFSNCPPSTRKSETGESTDHTPPPSIIHHAEERVGVNQAGIFRSLQPAPLSLFAWQAEYRCGPAFGCARFSSPASVSPMPLPRLSH
ncbi:hypothetical protein CVT26_004410 [Gymnopilus dilepis]|uniref:Uncharacterized protein n=1 Tax=Gymnopilus dilepis TaxID=231916 RepID=A0A409WN90_9AGAR|nr:hypothetical protein CVT26_004410 [Gymnopilus dilepis]